MWTKLKKFCTLLLMNTPVSVLWLTVGLDEYDRQFTKASQTASQDKVKQIVKSVSYHNKILKRAVNILSNRLDESQRSRQQLEEQANAKDRQLLEMQETIRELTRVIQTGYRQQIPQYDYMGRGGDGSNFFGNPPECN